MRERRAHLGAAPRGGIFADGRRSGMDIAKCFKDAWGLYKLDMGPLAVTAVVAGVIVAVASLLVGLIVGGSVTAVRFGGVAGGLGFASAVLASLALAIVGVVVYSWMLATVIHMIMRRVRERRAADYGDMSDFSELGTFMVAYVVLGLIVMVCYFALFIPGLIVTTLWIFALPLIIDHKLSLGRAMSESQHMAAAPGYVTTFATWFVGALVVGVIVAVFNLIPVVGLIIGLLAAPFGVGYVISMYFQSTGEGYLIDAALGQQSSAPRA
jgi:membrane-anchored glycerophosphoryl diester phosphodiesterase (GDPDase)